MPFEVIPAVDISRGRLARLTPNGPAPLQAFGGDPVAAAQAFLEAGAPRLHVVDIDRAFGRVGTNDDVIGRIAALHIPVQASGGFVTASDANRALALGADRVVMSSRALLDRAALEAVVAELGDAVIVGLEVDGASIRPRGNVTEVLPLEESLSWLAGIEIVRYLFTDLARLGELGGTDLDRIRSLAGALRGSLLVAGGVASAEDVRAVARLGALVDGAVVGRALYEGGVDLRELLDAGGS